ncbi:AAA family ATPase, partial [Myxococcota bacterium]|nr:AAA family ATPase [Myxococcota bacterium]
MYRGLLAEKFGSDVAELTARLLEPLPEKRFNDAASLQEALLEIEPSLRGIEKNNEKDNASSRTTTSSGNRSKVWAVLPDYREDFQRMADWSLGKQNFAEDLLFVSGGVGVGKSSLLGALSERVSDAEGMAIEMSCKAGSAGLQCMQEALRTLVADQSERGKAIATKINAALDAVGDDGRLRKILFFQTTEFSVSTHSRGDDEEDDFSERFIKRIVSFLRKLSEEETLVSLLIDDVDNIDSLTSSVLEKLLQEPLPDSMNIVGTILDDRLLRFRERWLGSDSDNRSSVIRLANISRSSIQRIIEQELRGASVSPELIELIERHAAGNVAAAREYLRGLLHEGAILPYWGRWRLDRNRLLNADLPTGLKALQEHRLSHLPEETLDFLAAILCLGNEFDLEIAEIIFEEPVSQILSKLRPAFDAQLIRTESYSKIKVVHENLSRRLSFRLSAERRQDIHHRAALAFDEKTSPKNNFALKAANHFLLGRPSENIERAYNIYLSASAASIGLYSWEEARVYLYAAESLTGEDYPATLDLFESLALVHSRLGHPEEAAKHYLLAVELAKSAEDKVELRLRRAKVLIGVREASRAKEELERCLDILGHSLPDQSLSSWFISLARWAGAGLMFLLRYKFGFLGKKGKRRLELLVRTYLKLFYVGYLQQNSSAMLQSTLRALHAGSRLGRQSPFFTDAQVNYALLISGAGYQKKANRILSKAEETAESIKDKHLKARISVAKSMSLHIAGHAS